MAGRNFHAQAIAFAELAEKSGILDRNIKPLASDTDVRFAVSGLAGTVTGYGNALGDKKQFAEARRAFDLALLIFPRHVPAWASLAALTFLQHDCSRALAWANKVLRFGPDPSSTDPWEQGLAQSMTAEGERRAAQVLGDPGLIGTWKEIQDSMRDIQNACRKERR